MFPPLDSSAFLDGLHLANSFPLLSRQRIVSRQLAALAASFHLLGS